MADHDQDPATPPLLLFDGACGFCRKSVLRLQASVGDRVACVPYQEHDFTDAPPGVTSNACAEAVHLLESDRRVSSGAEACFRALAYAPAHGWLRLAFRIPLVAPLAEWVYRTIAARRVGISRIQRVLSGPDATPGTFGFGRRAFALLLGVAFLAAFASFGVQAAGLIGSDGILPLGRMVAWDTHPLPETLLEMPTVFWFALRFASADVALFGVIVAGALAGLSLALGLWPRLALLVAWVAWLSLTALAFPPSGPQYIGNEFLGYQWDGLLVEVGVLALFVIPGGIRPRWRDAPSGAGIALLRLLLFRIVLGESLVKIVSGDPTWAEAGALGKHLWTGPLPTWIGLHVQEWGEPVLSALKSAGDLVGLVLVFGLFGPRRVRLLAALAIAVAECGGFLVSPRGAWPLVVLALACTAVDDQTWRRVLPKALAERVDTPDARLAPAPLQALRGVAAVVLAALALHVSWNYFSAVEPSATQVALQRAQLVNAYGPASSVTVQRFALTISGSDDGETWSTYEPRAIPRDPYRAPTSPGVHLRRLDWKLDDVAHRIALDEEMPTWFVKLLIRLLEGSPDVRGLFGAGSFESAPPRALRVEVHELLPATPEDRAKHGMWWYRRAGSRIGSPVMLEDGELVPAEF